MDGIWEKLYREAFNVIDPREISGSIYAGSVGAAVLTAKGNIYTGICIDTNCSLGMCAERNALSSMISCGEDEAERVVAVYRDGEVMPPCGACREFMMQLKNGRNIQIMLDRSGRVKRLEELMPEYPY
ncbi:MAG: cytidine deaminase [Ruminococcus sp.]|nr:cytidine deaminase [Ruminococcus sp.]